MSASPPGCAGRRRRTAGSASTAWSLLSPAAVPSPAAAFSRLRAARTFPASSSRRTAFRWSPARFSSGVMCRYPRALLRAASGGRSTLRGGLLTRRRRGGVVVCCGAAAAFVMACSHPRCVVRGPSCATAQGASARPSVSHPSDPFSRDPPPSRGPSPAGAESARRPDPQGLFRSALRFYRGVGLLLRWPIRIALLVSSPALAGSWRRLSARSQRVGGGRVLVPRPSPASFGCPVHDPGGRRCWRLSRGCAYYRLVSISVLRRCSDDVWCSLLSPSMLQAPPVAHRSSPLAARLGRPRPDSASCPSRRRRPPSPF